MLVDIRHISQVRLLSFSLLLDGKYAELLTFP
jgi:hypothetical protein